LPAEIRTTADKNYALLKDNPQHPSLHFKRVGPLWSARVGDQYRVNTSAIVLSSTGGALTFLVSTPKISTLDGCEYPAEFTQRAEQVKCGRPLSHRHGIAGEDGGLGSNGAVVDVHSAGFDP
jgi:hypothetical protein